MNYHSDHFTITLMAPGVYAAIARPGGVAEANAGIIDLGGRTLIFDTLMSHIAAADLRQAAERLTDQPVSYVINSHWHLDHIRGNQVFDEHTTIISTHHTRQLIDTNGRADVVEDLDGSYLARLRDRIAGETDPILRTEWQEVLSVFERISAEAHDVQIRLPDLTFERCLNLYGAVREVMVLSYGGGETASDAVLYLPAEQILFTGDLVSVAMQPLVTGGDVVAWQHILTTLALHPIHRILPGHGPIGTAEDITHTGMYLRRLQQTVREAIAAGMNGEAAARTLPGSPFDSWTGRRFWALNVRHLMG